MISPTRAILAVADGVGGSKNGKLAAFSAVDFINKHLTRFPLDLRQMADVASKAGEMITALNTARADSDPMGTTLTAVAVDGLEAGWVHVGDSRVHQLRVKGSLETITQDHRFIQELINTGELSPAQALTHPMKNILDQCLGCPDLKPDTGRIKLSPGDHILLTTDGLHDHVQASQMVSAFLPTRALDETADILLKQAIKNNSRDNLCLAIARLE